MLYQAYYEIEMLLVISWTALDQIADQAKMART